MDDAINTLECRTCRRSILYLTDHHLGTDRVKEGAKLTGCREVVQYPDGVSLSQQLKGKNGTEITGPSSDQISHARVTEAVDGRVCCGLA
jgi:hypothetical protein